MPIPPVATGFATAGRSLNLALLPEVIIGLGCVPLAGYGLPGTPALTEPMLPLIPKYDALLMANHGAVCYGEDVFKAYFKMETMEHFARIALVAELLGGARLCPAWKWTSFWILVPAKLNVYQDGGQVPEMDARRRRSAAAASRAYSGGRVSPDGRGCAGNRPGQSVARHRGPGRGAAGRDQLPDDRVGRGRPGRRSRASGQPAEGERGRRRRRERRRTRCWSPAGTLYSLFWRTFMIARLRLHPLGLLAGASSVVAAAAVEAVRLIMKKS